MIYTFLEAPCIIPCFLKCSFRETMLQLLGWNSAIKQNKIMFISDLKICAYTLQITAADLLFSCMS